MAADWLDLLFTGLAGLSAFVTIAAALAHAVVFLWRTPGGMPGLFSRGRLQALADMRDDPRTTGELATYLDSELALEKFRTASGISANHQQMVALMRLFRMGMWEREEIRSLARYLKVSPIWPCPRIEIGRPEQVEAISALVIGVALPLSGALVWAALILKLPIYGFLLGALAFLFSVLLAGWVGKAWGDLRSAKRIKAYLDDHPHILQSAARAASQVKAAA